MKKTIVGILSFVFLFIGAQGVYASGPFNGQSGDCSPGIGIGVYPGNIQKDGYGCWSNTSVTANAGDTINVAMYYHNNTGSTLTNVSGSIVKSSSGPSTSYTFTGKMYSDQGTTTVGTVTLNLTSSQTLTYSSTHWMKDASAIIYNTDTQVFNNDGGQISIGSVPAGWNDYGEFLAVFKVSNTVKPQGTCQDLLANNVGLPLPCTFTVIPPVQTCNDPTASNPGSVGACIPFDLHKIKVTIIGSGTVTATNSPIINSVSTYKDNGSDFFSFSPASGFHFESASFDSTPINTSYGYAVYNINEDHEIKVTFVKDASAVITPTGNITATPTCTIPAGYSTCNTTLVWSTQNAVSTSSVTSNNATIATSNSSYGKEVAIEKGTRTFYLYNNSNLLSQASTTASCATGSTWTNTYCKTDTVTPPVGNTTYFDVRAYKITGNGTINNSTASYVTVSVKSSETATFTLTPDQGYMVDRIEPSPSSPCLVGTRSGNTYTTGIVTGFCAFHVYFKSAPVNNYTLTYIAETGGTISGNSSQTVKSGGSGTAVTAIANAGYTFDKWSDGKTGASRTDTNITANKTVYASFTKNVIVNNCSIIDFSASTYSVNSGGYSTLSWNTIYCDSVRISGINYNLPNSSNSQIVYPTATTNYLLTATGANGVSQTKNVTITVIPAPVKCTDLRAINVGSIGDCIFSNNTDTSVINSNTTTNSNNNNSINNSNNNNSINNSNNTTTTNNITNGGSNTQPRCLDTSASNYYEYGSCVHYNYDRTIRCMEPSANNYLSYATCTYNTQVRCMERSASNYLAYNNCIYNVVLNKNVVTTVATNIASNQAQINGYITNSTFYNSNVYFNYGTTVNLGNRTNGKTASGNSYFNDFLTGLSPNTIYFFQAVGENSTGISKGNIEVFKTLGDGTIRPIIIQGTTVIGTGSPIQLTITNKYELIGQGDLIDYVVTYKNVSKSRISRPMVQVVLPTNVTLINSSRGTYSVDTHTLSAPLADLFSGEEGVIYIQGRVDSIPLNNAQIATTAILVYTNGSNTQENAMAYVLNQPRFMNGIVTTEGSVLGANAFFAGLLSIGLLGWLLILLLILIIVLIAKSYSRNNTSTDSKTITHTTTH